LNILKTILMRISINPKISSYAYNVYIKWLGITKGLSKSSIDTTEKKWSILWGKIRCKNAKMEQIPYILKHLFSTFELGTDKFEIIFMKF
jgi:hypothetical protein